MNKHCSILAVTNRRDYVNKIFANYNRQAYDNKELIIVLNSNDIQIEDYEQYTNKDSDIRMISCDEELTLGECKTAGLKLCNYDFISFFDDDDYYGPKFLSDSLDVFDRKRCDIVGKKTFYVYFEASKKLAICLGSQENRFVYHIADSSMIVKRHVIEKVDFPKIKGSGTITTFQSDCISKGLRIYSTNRHHYVAHRHAMPLDTHTWKITDKDLLKHCRLVSEDIDDYTRIVNT